MFNYSSLVSIMRSLKVHNLRDSVVVLSNSHGFLCNETRDIVIILVQWHLMVWTT